MKEESRKQNPWTDPELEARIVALVLGEASDFEREELQRLIEEWPDLAAFKEQIQDVHGLLRDVATGESVPEDDDLRLAADKRNTVLAVISGAPTEHPAEHAATVTLPEERRPVRQSLFWNLTGIAVVVGIAGLLAVMTIPAWIGGAMSDSNGRLKQLALAMQNYHDTYKTFDSGSQRAVRGEPSLQRGKMTLWNDATRWTAEDESLSLRTAEPAAVADFDYEENSRSALSAIRGTLDGDGALPSPDYLADDVQYFPPRSEFKLPTGADTSRGRREGREQDRVAGGRFMFGAGVNSEAGVTGAVTVDEWNFALDLNADGERLTDPQPAARKPVSGGLSFPMLAADSGDRNTSGPAGEVRSTISVPDGGTVLLGGIKRQVAGQSEQGAAGESAGPAAMERYGYGESKSGDETQEAAGTRAAGSGDSSTVENGVANRLTVLPGQIIDSRDVRSSERRLKSSQLFQNADHTLAAGEKPDRIVADAGIEANSGGNAQAGDGKMNAWMAPGLEEVGEVHADDWRKTGQLADSIPAPTTEPQLSGKRIETMDDLTVIDGLQEEAVKEGLAMPGADDITGVDASGLAKDSSFSIQMPEPEAEIALTPNIVPDRRNVLVVPLPVRGTAIDQPRSELENAPAKPDERGGQVLDSKGYFEHVEQDFGTKRSAAEESDGPTKVTIGSEAATEKYAKDRLERLAELSNLHKSLEIDRDVLVDDDDKNGTRSRYSRQSGLKGKQSELLHRGNQLATSGRERWGEYVPPVLVDNSKSMKVWDATSPVPAGLSEASAEEEAFSTFSLHVSDVSFKLARAALAGGQWPEAAKVRIEEFVNAFDYGDPMPTQREKVSCRLEQSVHPFLQQRNLLRISMRTAAAGRSSSTPLRLTFVLDNSGSMERSDRRQTVRRAFALLAQQLKPIDQITLISFARQPRLLADKVSGSQSQQLLELIADLPSEGGTNIEAALQLAFEKAKEQQTDGAQNRIILLTDGAVNLGDANPESLSRMIATMRVAGIAFDAAGICADGLNDEVLEALTRQGDGRYYLLDSWEAADAGFARQIAGALRPSAKNVKIQVEFNPQRVGRYKLLGFEKHLLNQEDFRNDAVDAAEMAAAEAGVAMYQFEAKPDGEGDVGSVSVRFQDLSTGQMIEHRWPIPYESTAPRIDQAAPSLRVAASAAMLAARLRGEPLGETVDLRTLSDLIAGLPQQDRTADRVQQLYQMIQQARQLAGE